MRLTFEVPDVSCGHCKSAIEGALRPLGGVREAEVDVASKQVAVELDENRIDRVAVIDAIESAGYTVSA